jgi:hypothetical protein
MDSSSNKRSQKPYHAALTQGFVNFAEPQHAEATKGLAGTGLSAGLHKYFSKRHITMEGKGIQCNFKPLLISEALDKQISHKLKTFLGVLEKIPGVWSTSKGLRDQYGVPDKVLLTLLAEPERKRWVDFCRFDFVLEPTGRMQIMEINSSQPGGVSMIRHLHDFFLASEELTCFLEKLQLRVRTFPYQDSPILAERLIRMWQAKKETQRLPNVAVVNNRYNTYEFELDLFKSEFEDKGCRTAKTFIQDLVYDRGELKAQGLSVDLCYLKLGFEGKDTYTLNPISHSTNEILDFILAVRNDDVVIANSLHSNFLLENKSTLACLRHPDVLAKLNAEEIAIIDEIVPDTRIVSSLDSSAIAELKECRDQYALKQSLNTRGHGIVLGWTVSQQEWESVLATASTEKDPQWIVQRRLNLVAYSEGEKPVYNTFAYYFVEGQPSGMIMRESEEPVTNVGQTGRIQPCFIGESSAGGGGGSPWT